MELDARPGLVRRLGEQLGPLAAVLRELAAPLARRTAPSASAPVHLAFEAQPASRRLARGAASERAGAPDVPGRAAAPGSSRSTGAERARPLVSG